jgi:AraC-like DNA-binding protein
LPLQIPKRFLHEYTENALGRKLQGSIVFDPEISSAVPQKSAWKSASDALFDIADGRYGNLHRSWNLGRGELLLELLLQSQSSNVTAFFEQKTPDAGQVFLRRAEEYIRSNCAEHISLLSISEAAGVTGRTLQLAYKARYGHSPMRALMLDGLRRVRFDLLACHHTESVTDVALKWGFNHLGRFSAAYKSEFGELPNETMGRSLRR